MGWEFDLLKASREGNVSLCRDTLTKPGANVNYQTPGSMHPLDTALHIALRKQHKEVASYLLSKGADIRIENEDGESPMLIAENFGLLDWFMEETLNADKMMQKLSLKDQNEAPAAKETAPANPVVAASKPQAPVTAPAPTSTKEESQAPGPAKVTSRTLSRLGEGGFFDEKGEEIVLEDAFVDGSDSESETDQAPKNDEEHYPDQEEQSPYDDYPYQGQQQNQYFNYQSQQYYDNQPQYYESQQQYYSNQPYYQNQQYYYDNQYYDQGYGQPYYGNYGQPYYHANMTLNNNRSQPTPNRPQQGAPSYQQGSSGHNYQQNSNGAYSAQSQRPTGN